MIVPQRILLAFFASALAVWGAVCGCTPNPPATLYTVRCAPDVGYGHRAEYHRCAPEFSSDEFVGFDCEERAYKEQYQHRVYARRDLCSWQIEKPVEGGVLP